MPTLIHKQYFENAKAALPTNGDRQKWLTMSTETPDRSGDVMVLAGMDSKAFMQNPQFIWQHSQSGAEVSTIGKILQLQVIGGQLLALAEFAPADISPIAETIFQLSVAGYLPANSIGFRPLEWENNDTGGCTYTKWELVECSKVEIPMNPEAIDKSLKHKTTIELDTTEMVEKSGRTFSSENEKEIRDSIAGIQEHCMKVLKRLDDAAPAEKTDPPPMVEVKPKKNLKLKLLQAEMLNGRINN